MDILILNWKDIKNPQVGGAEIIIYEMAKRFVRDGHTVTWFCRNFPNGKPTDYYDGIRVLRKGNLLSVYWHAYRYYASLSKKPDRVIDCINTICWQTPLYVPKEKRVMWVNQLAKEVLLYELPFPVSYVAYVLERLEYMTYKDTRVLCYASSTKEDLTSFGIPQKNISVFPLGIDHDRYIPGVKSRDPLFIFVARLAAMKRPQLCIDAMQIVMKKYPKAKLAIVGYGPLKKHLRYDNNIYLVNKNALYFNANPEDQKVKLMQQAWALLMPSVKEGWGMVVTEAAACATPSIVTDVTGLSDSVVSEETGIVISRNPRPAELATAMMRMIEQKQFRLELSKAARNFSKNFTWEASYHKMIALML